MEAAAAMSPGTQPAACAVMSPGVGSDPAAGSGEHMHAPSHPDMPGGIPPNQNGQVHMGGWLEPGSPHQCVQPGGAEQGAAATSLPLGCEQPAAPVEPSPPFTLLAQPSAGGVTAGGEKVVDVLAGGLSICLSA